MLTITHDGAITNDAVSNLNGGILRQPTQTMTAVTQLPPGTSPYSFTNTTQFAQQHSIRGGTVSSVTIDGFNLDNGGISAAQDLNFILPSGSTAIITYTVAPTEWFMKPICR